MFHGARGATEIRFDEIELNEALVEQAFDGALQRSWIQSSETSTLDWLTRSMRVAAGVSHGLIGELAGSDWNQVQTVAVDTAEGPGENFRYDLTGTPCAEVVGVTSCAYPRATWLVFPRPPRRHGHRELRGAADS